MSTFGIIAIIVSVVIIVALIFGNIGDSKPATSPSTQKKEFSMDIEMLGDEQKQKDDYSDYFFNTYIAGASHHCTNKDVGVFAGFAVPDPDNEYDKDAVAIINNDGKLLGYIAKKELGDFRVWSNNKAVPCVGHIALAQEEEGSLHTNVKCMRPYSLEFVQEEVKKYVDWYKEKYK